MFGGVIRARLLLKGGGPAGTHPRGWIPGLKGVGGLKFKGGSRGTQKKVSQPLAGPKLDGGYPLPAGVTDLKKKPDRGPSKIRVRLGLLSVAPQQQLTQNSQVTDPIPSRGG